ncbi:sister chromatid cohesion protein-like protein Mis4 [Periconia macrospinosa]|uniref:Sister chromatid cohesion protein n=1 Tax=Periconia macrospinosa TaxID=97972 RepID=A0A2V1E2V2_9PLEO|nr:sister chromatid cohesion protein-like protein Mis4 [Periconia macrospinosa]
MAAFDATTNNWHNGNGGGLPFRPPPTVDEALPYSPFTSVVPFSPDVIPYPVAEPPTPPTTLSQDQQSAAKKAVGILNSELSGPSSTAQHLEDTFRELRNLLGNPLDMTEFRFKTTSQLVTPPPDSPSGLANGNAPTKPATLSPFASMLLKQTDVHYQPAGVQPVAQMRIKSEPTVNSQQATPRSASQTPSRPVPPSSNRIPHIQNGVHQSSPVTPTSSVSSQAPRSGPAVVIKPLGPNSRREEYLRYDNLPVEKHSVEQKSEHESALAALMPQEREIAEQKIERLHKLTKRLHAQRENDHDSEDFEQLSCLDSDVTVMRPATLDRLYDRVMSVQATGCFSSVSVDAIKRIHVLCEPSITALDQSSLFNQMELEAWPSSIRIAESGLKACKLTLTTMLEGREDRRVTPEDLVIAVVDALKRVIQSCILPVLESRRTGENAELFNHASGLRDKLKLMILSCTSVLKGLAPLISKMSLTHNAVNPIEYLALALLVQQNSDSEKDSIFGLQKFEALRQAAMEVLTQVFAAHPNHQHSITTEILNNLEKLPDKGTNARQFKSVRDPPIMTVSALFMRFVQVASTNQHNQHKQRAGSPGEDESADDDESDYDSDAPSKKKKAKKSQSSGNTSARSLAQLLTSNAKAIAGRIASVLTERAMNVSKSGDKPFRNLLDMFVEDFCNVLGSPEWPAATVLLQQLLRCMIGILNSGSNKDMALTMMGSMGSGIIDFKLRLKRLRRELSISPSDLSSKLDQLTEDALEKGIDKKDLLGVNGPYRMVIESLPDYLKVDATQADPHLLSVQGCYVTFWLDDVAQHLQPKGDDGNSNDKGLSELQGRLETMFTDSKWLSREYKFQNVSEMQSRLAAGLITLHDAFCQYLDRIVNTMIHYTRENAATLKSKAIKNIAAFLDKDAQTIPQQLIMGVIGLLRDNSPLVRADAVALVAKCWEGNPAHERHYLSGILSLTTDPSNGPKKKAIDLLKKVYQITSSGDHKLSIVASLLLPSQDHEKAISDMSRQALEDIWLTPLTGNAKTDESVAKLKRVERASLLVQTVRRIQGQTAHLEAFEKLFATALTSQSANVANNVRICTDMVSDMVEGVISPDSLAAGCSQEHVLQTLSILARVYPKLFSASQLQLLKLYVKNPVTVDDLNILRPTVTIFRFVLPCIPNLQKDFADEVWGLLSKVISKLASWAGRGNPAGKETLRDVVHCSWMISPLATMGVHKMIQVVSSTVTQLQPLSSVSKEEAEQAKGKIVSYLILVGTFGKVCNFDDEYADVFRAAIAKKARAEVNAKKTTEERMKNLLKPGTIAPSILLLEAVRPFTKQMWEMIVRDHALSGMGEICQGSPALFRRKDVEATFKVVFKNDVVSLKRIALTQFHDFFIRAERRPNGDNDVPSSQQTPSSNLRLGTTFVAGDNQVTTNYLARTFLSEVVEIALKTEGELALLATNIITSVNRQGLVHPKECGAALIALGTSPNTQIAQAASIEHKKIHDAHESMFEKEYMAAVKMAFDYQREVYDDAHGMNASYKPKLLQAFSTVKGGNRKTLKKFLDNFCKQIDFDLAKLEDPEVGQTTLLYARFCLENLALFDVSKLEDVAIMTNSLENIVMKLTGPSVGIAIDTEMSKTTATHAPPPVVQESLPAQPAEAESALLPTAPVTSEPISAPDAQESPSGISEARLLQLTRACMILLMMWETRGFIRRAYNLHNQTGRIQHKDYQKPVSRNNFTSGKDLWERLDAIFNSTESSQTMIKRCHEFAELLEVDKDARLGDEEDEGENEAGYITPDEVGEENETNPNSGRGRKRKSSATSSNTPKKRGRPNGSKSGKRNSKTPDADGWD